MISLVKQARRNSAKCYKKKKNAGWHHFQAPEIWEGFHASAPVTAASAGIFRLSGSNPVLVNIISQGRFEESVFEFGSNVFFGLGGVNWFWSSKVTANLRLNPFLTFPEQGCLDINVCVSVFNRMFELFA